MIKNYLIADSGATKCQWTLVQNNKKSTIKTIGISPYFLSTQEITQLLQKSFAKKTDLSKIEAVYFYGTGLSNPGNVLSLKKALKAVFTKAKLTIETDLVAAEMFLEQSFQPLHPAQQQQLLRVQQQLILRQLSLTATLLPFCLASV